MEIKNDIDCLMNIQEAAAYLSISRFTLWRMVKDFQIPFIVLKSNGKRSTKRFKKVSLNEWLNSRTVQVK